MTTSDQQRRRADDWRDVSTVGLRARFLRDICSALGYTPSDVIAIRIRPTEVVVTYSEADGMPRSTKHPILP